jgi:hypothetical protein
MSRTTVRATVASFLSPPNVAGLNKVFTAAPKRVEGTWFRYGQPAGTFSGGIAVVNIVAEREERIALGGEHGGKKWIHYEVSLDIFFHSVQRRSEDAMTDFDTLIDNIKTRIRADRRLGNDAVIFESGERYLDGEYGEPRVLQDGATEIWGSIRFEVSEVITS